MNIKDKKYNFNIKQHRDVLVSLLREIAQSQKDKFILKGGTALMYSYKLDRFSEDIDFDARTNISLEGCIKQFCSKRNYEYRKAKETDTVHRFFIHYHGDKPLKIEISYRDINIEEEYYTKINDIYVYTIDSLCMLKTIAYTSRDKIRDLYDICFIVEKYWDTLSKPVKLLLKKSFINKGFEQFDYLMLTQKDDLLSTDILEDRFLKLYEKLELLPDEKNYRMRYKYNLNITPNDI